MLKSIIIASMIAMMATGGAVESAPVIDTTAVLNAVEATYNPQEAFNAKWYNTRTSEDVWVDSWHDENKIDMHNVKRDKLNNCCTTVSAEDEAYYLAWEQEQFKIMDDYINQWDYECVAYAPVDAVDWWMSNYFTYWNDDSTRDDISLTSFCHKWSDGKYHGNCQCQAKFATRYFKYRGYNADVYFNSTHCWSAYYDETTDSICWFNKQCEVFYKHYA